MAPDRSKAGGNRNRPDILTDPRAIQRVHLDHHQISSHQNVVKTIKDTPITDLADVEVDKTSDDFAAGQSLVWGGDSWIAGDPEVLIPVKAAEEMTKGTPVYVSDEQASGKPIVSKADSDGTDTYPAIGLLLTDLAAGAEGHAVGGGIISGLDTSSYTVGDALYLSSSPGVLTSTRPTATNEKVQKVAVVARSHAEAGTVIVMGAGRTNDVPNELTTLTGVALDATDLGTFNATTFGVRIPDNSDNKEAFQYLSTTLDAAYEEARQATNGVSGLDADLQALVTYHDRYATEAETTRSGATETVEVYYTARPDGDGLAESEVTTSTPAGFVIERKLYFSDKFNADPDTAADWTLYTTQPADNTAFATAKASLLAGLSDTDGTANTRGTLPVSLKMTHRFSQDLLLEDFPGAAAAYSLRKISSDYTGSAIRIREDGTNTEADIGFDSNGDLDTAAIATHCGSNNGFVKIWYDQSGNSNDATQSTAANQPQIYNGSAVITENGKPTIDFDGSNDSLISALTVNTTDLAVSSVQTFDSLAGGQMGITISEAALNQLYLPYNNPANNWLFKYKAVDQNFTADTNQNLISFYTNGTSTYFYKNGATLGSALTASALVSSNGVRIGSWSNGTLNADINCQELIIWQSNQSANRTDIEADISAYWTANKRLLDNYPGATFGGAVRRLDNDYTGSCMRIRRSSDNTEQDIGFDSSGNLDTAAIETFCTTSTGWVTKLYDQSGSGNDAYQTITSLQPQIYDGSKVLVYNGRPSMRATTASTYLRWTGVLITGTGARSMLVVANPDSALNDNVLALTSSGSGNGTTWNWTTEVAVRVLGAQVFGNNGMSTQTVGMLTFPSGGQIADIDYYENSVQATPTSTTASVSINTASTGYSFMHATEGWMHECLMWESDQTSNQSDIYTEVEGYYQTQTQLLLDTYGGAAAAYSVRKLSQWYTGYCMRVRNVNDNSTADIGFDSNGDLDEAAIATLCGSYNGAVEIWYDQSGGGHHQVQETTTLQPLIYLGSAGAVLKENGKPVIVFIDGGQLQNVSHSTITVNLMTGFNSTSPNPGYTFSVVGPGTDYGSTSNFYIGSTDSLGTRFGLCMNFGTSSPDFGFTCTHTVNQTTQSSPTTLSLYTAVGSQAVVTTEWVSTNTVTLRWYINYNASFTGNLQVQEYVIYYSDKSSDQAAIEDAINGYYGAYT